MTETLTAEKQKTISIERTFNLPVTTVWKAWTESESYKKWASPKEYTSPSSSIDVKIGGKYLNSMKGPDGKEIWSTGTYKEIIPLKKIIYTDNFSDSKGNVVAASDYNMPGEWARENIVTVEFEEEDGKTNMKLQHTGLAVEIADECIKGWQSCFDKLESNFK